MIKITKQDIISLYGILGITVDEDTNLDTVKAKRNGIICSRAKWKNFKNLLDQELVQITREDHLGMRVYKVTNKGFSFLKLPKYKKP